MMRDGNPNAFARQVHFANGFPPKGLVQAASPYMYSGSAVASPQGHYVSLDEMSTRVGRAHRSIPPLAKGRGQFCSMKNRPEDDRYRRRPDPFKLPKAAEKTGFTASQIKRAKPRMIRACRSTEPPSPPPATSTVYNLKNLARRAVYSTPPSRPLDSDLEDDVVSTPVELKSKNSRIISDVEKESIQAELAGLEEVYQRVCRGKIESLYSLLYPSRRDTKRGPVQYINTSAPVQLRTPKITQHMKKPGTDKDAAATSVTTTDVEKTRNDENGLLFLPGSEDDDKHENSTRPILIPLPYIRSDISMSTLGKQQKPAYNAPYIYSNRTNKPTTRLAHPVNNASPAVINFSPMNIPDISRPGTKNSMFVGSKSSALNKSNGTSGVPDVSMQSAIPVPFLSSPGPFKGSTPNQTPALFDEADAEEKLGKLDIESVDSEPAYPAQKVSEGSDDDGKVITENSASNEREEEEEEETAVDGKEKNGDENPGEEMVAKGIRFSLTTDKGLLEGVEIYDYDKRDIESEQEAAKHIQELEEIGEQNIREYAELLEEHQHILDEVKQLEKDLNKPPE